MKIFILESVDQLTDRYHSGGGLVVIANDLSHAKEIIKDYEECKPTEQEWTYAKVFELKNDTEPIYWIFQDAGCC